MERVIKQAIPAANILEILYNVGPSNNALVTLGSLLVCNQENVATTFSMTIVPAGEADADRNYIFRDVDLSAKQTFQFNLNNPLKYGDKIKVASGNGKCSFTLSGMALTPNNP